MDDFTLFTSAQYRALDADAFAKREKDVYAVIDGGTIPEGVTLDDLSAELDMIEAEKNFRSKRNRVLNANIEAVKSGAGTVIASDETEEKDERTMPKAEGTFQARNRETSQHYTDTAEYREAWANHVTRREQMPARMVYQALQERANTPVSINADFTNMTDPTFSNTTGALVAAPYTLSQEVQREMREFAVLYPKVNHTTFQGMYAVSELDLAITGAWIGDKETSPYQDDYDPEVFTWGWHQFEARHARTLLAQAVMDARYDQLAEALGECFGNAADAAVVSGNGTTQPRGIINDLRLVGSDGLGNASALTSWYTQSAGTGKGRATIIEVTAADVDDWRFWKSLLYNTKFNRLYRGKGELVIGDGTWGNHINLLQDDNKQPIGLYKPLSEDTQLSIVGVGPVDTMPNSIIPDFDSASVGDVIGFYGNPRNYTMNEQPGLQLSTVSWTDHETNTYKTKMLVAMDGRVHDPFGWVILKKAASA